MVFNIGLSINMFFSFSVTVSSISEALVCFHKMPFKHICFLQQINKHGFMRERETEIEGGDGSLSVLKTDETEFL